MTERDQEEQDLRIEFMGAQLDQIRLEMERARRDFATWQEHAAERERHERQRFIVQMIVTTIAGVTAAVALLMHLMGKL